MSPPTRRGPGGKPGDLDRSADQAARQGPAYSHAPDRCVTCSGVQHRDVIADLWWSWAAPYRALEVAA